MEDSFLCFWRSWTNSYIIYYFLLLVEWKVNRTLTKTEGQESNIPRLFIL